jgi:hypothetical protein
MTTQNPTSGSKSTLGNVMAVLLVVWLLFFGGFSTLKSALTPARLNQASQIADTIKTGVNRVTTGSSAPATKPGAAPGIAPRTTSGAPAAVQPASNQAAVDAAYQATVQAVNAAHPAIQPAAQSGTLPTAAIVYPTVPPAAQITIVPIAYPQTYASSDPPTITPIPTLVYPTPLPAAAAAFTLSPDGKCVIVARADGNYQQCQDWPYSAAEATSVADYLRTGLVPGTKVN